MQKLKVASVRIFGEILNREAIDNSDNLSRATEVAYEFCVGLCGPSDLYTKNAPAESSILRYSVILFWRSCRRQVLGIDVFESDEDLVDAARSAFSMKLDLVTKRVDLDHEAHGIPCLSRSSITGQR